MIAYFVFSFSRVAVYLLLSLLIFLAGRIFASGFSLAISKYVFISGGIFIVLLGIFSILGRNTHSRACAFLHEKFIRQDKKSVVVLGVITALAPCAPLLAVFSYLALVSQTIFNALIYALAFGLGTFISPLLILAAGAGWLGKILDKNEYFAKIFNFICGLVVVCLGIILIKRGIFNA